MFKGNKNGNQGILNHNNYQYFVANTGSDGLFTVTLSDGDTETIEVDGGNIGVMPMELVTVKDIEDYGIITNLDNLVIQHVDLDYFTVDDMRIELTPSRIVQKDV